MKHITLKQRLRYAFDKSMDSGTSALIAWLALVSALIILLAALGLALSGAHQDEAKRLSFVESLWSSLMHAMDSGALGGDTGWGFRGVMLVVTLAGLFIVGSLIGILSSGIEGRLEHLRKGRSLVIEENHTLILGWSPALFSILSELALANANQQKPRIVILADRDKVEMEDEIRAQVARLGRTQVICRTGSPMDTRDLQVVSPDAARSIIILSPPEDGADAQVIKTILALTNNPSRRAEPYHIVASIRERKNLEVARMVGGSEVQLVLGDDLISRITVQAARQSGISAVYTDLLDYEGDEIYFQAEPSLVGKSFGSALLAYEQAAPIGLHRGGGRLMLNPPSETVIEEGDEIIAIAQDDDKIILSSTPAPPIDEAAISQSQAAPLAPERTLILGWNRRGPMVLAELDVYVAEGSQVTVVAVAQALGEVGEEGSGLQVLAKGAAARLKNQAASFVRGDTTDRDTLDGLGVPSYDHVIVLGYSELMGEQEADAQTLITLLHLRRIAQESRRERAESGGSELGGKVELRQEAEAAGATFSIVSEMLDARNRELASVTQADDFIVSDKLVSLMLAQVSENKHLNAVLEDIFDAGGSELYLKPAQDYILPGRAVSFYTVVESARRRGHIAIGYRQAAHAQDASQSYGVRLNPRKSDMVSFRLGDRVIVLAES